MKILAAVDFFPASLRALGYAVRLARAVDAQLVLVHACHATANGLAIDLAPATSMASLRDAAEGDLRVIVSTLRDNGVRAAAIVREGAPAEAILAVADDVDADLVVLGTHGRRGVTRLALGSVAEQIVRRSPVPVITLHEWRFHDRGAAGRRLADRVRPLRVDYDRVVAMTRGAVPIAVPVARALGAPVEALMVAPIERRAETPIGAACEDGTFLLDDAAVKAQRVEPSAIARGVEDALSTARHAAEWLRRSGPPDVDGRGVLVIADRLVAPTAAIVCARALRKLGAKRVALAVPVCASPVLDALAPELDATVVIEATPFEPATARVYRDDEAPSNVDAASMLGRGERPLAR